MHSFHQCLNFFPFLKTLSHSWRWGTQNFDREIWVNRSFCAREAQWRLITYCQFCPSCWPALTLPSYSGTLFQIRCPSRIFRPGPKPESEPGQLWGCPSALGRLWRWAQLEFQSWSCSSWRCHVAAALPLRTSAERGRAASWAGWSSWLTPASASASLSSAESAEPAPERSFHLLWLFEQSLKKDMDRLDSWHRLANFITFIHFAHL